MKKLPLLLVALLMALAALVSTAPKPASAIIRCFNCPPGWISSGPPTCRCVRGNL